MSNKINLSYEDLELVSKALLTHRWFIEERDGQTYEFHRVAAIADRLACNHNGAVLVFNTEVRKEG